jgi:prolyl oligopeptidase
VKRTQLSLAILVGCSPQPKPAAPATPPPSPPRPVVLQPVPRQGPAPAKVDPIVDTLHGVAVPDPYRWMEHRGPEFDAFLDAQNAQARKTLAAIPGRDQLRDALHTANLGVTRVTIVEVTGPVGQPRVFLMKRAPSDDSAQLFVRDGWAGKDRLLVDPRTRNTQAMQYSIDYASPSPDGKHVAYGISASGSEDSVIEILDVERGTLLRERIDRAQYAGIDWRDNRSFFHWRRRAPAPGDTRADWFKNSATYLHVLGNDPERAQPVFGPTMAELGLAAEDFNGVESSPRSPWALGSASPGTSADVEYFVAPLAKVIPAQTPWRRLSGPHDHVVAMLAHGDTIYALSYADAPRYRVLAIDAANGTLQSARVFVAEGSAVIEGMVAAEDALYLQLFDGGQTRIERVSYDGTRRSEVKLPFQGSAAFIGASDRPGIVISAESWTRAPSDFSFDPTTGVRDLALREPWPTDYSHLTSELVEATSADGTKVPMSIIHRKDLVRDGSAPGLVTGYQSYDVIDRPYFAALSLAWVDRGGVRATCHGRGSGNQGKQWHLGGVKHNKERGVEDFIACAEYLVEHKYTAPSRLTVTGTSSGGLIAGGAVTRRPELYAAALLRVPVINLTRFETTEGGLANVPEYGSLADAADYKAMHASDPYHRVVDGTKYPAMLITGGKHDVRVPIWLPAKFTARAQAATMSDRPILLRVEFEGGHGLGSTRTQTEEEWADLYAFALWQSGVPVAG